MRGYAITSESFSHPLISFPSNYLVAILLIFTLVANIKDIGDEAGDRLAGTYTIPVLVGEKKGRIIIAVFVAISYLLSVFILYPSNMILWVSASFCAILSFILILKLRKPDLVFVIYYLYFIALFLLISQ